jgi:DtxR family transcriptional regulator, Mn-dependent transcriptional regulator
MQKNSLEDYIGAIYRLRPANGDPLPLNRLQDYFGFSPISIHEMVTKLDQQGLIVYLPYKGVRLSRKGEEAASNLIRRHRIWERFLTDQLNVAWDESHEIAGELEHAAPDWITERLANLIGNPEACPHGDWIPSVDGKHIESEDTQVESPGCYRISKVSPEVPVYLSRLQELELMPGNDIEVTLISDKGFTIRKDGKNILLPTELINTVWVKPHS